MNKIEQKYIKSNKSLLMTDKNVNVWQSNFQQLIKFRETHGRLPSNNTKDQKYSGEVKYNYGNKRDLPTAIIDGKKIKKSSTICLDDDVDNHQKITIINCDSKILDGYFNQFLSLLNEALITDNRDPINPETIITSKLRSTINIDDIDCKGLPEYKFNTELQAVSKLKICFSKSLEKSESFRNIFMEKINQRITNRTSSIWFPNKLESMNTNGNIYVDSEEPIIPKYPIYIVSYKRHDTRLTVKYLEECGIGYN